MEQQKKNDKKIVTEKEIKHFGKVLEGVDSESEEDKEEENNKNKSNKNKSIKVSNKKSNKHEDEKK